MAAPRCPVCHEPPRYPEDTVLGWCQNCGKFTGKCQAGRTIHSGAIFDAWTYPCPRSWTSWYVIAKPGAGMDELTQLCDEHGDDVDAGRAPVTGRRVQPPGVPESAEIR
jgi:hypothetical protein